MWVLPTIKDRLNPSIDTTVQVSPMEGVYINSTVPTMKAPPTHVAAGGTVTESFREQTCFLAREQIRHQQHRAVGVRTRNWALDPALSPERVEFSPFWLTPAAICQLLFFIIIFIILYYVFFVAVWSENEEKMSRWIIFINLGEKIRNGSLDILGMIWISAGFQECCRSLLEKDHCVKLEQGEELECWRSFVL